MDSPFFIISIILSFQNLYFIDYRIRITHTGSVGIYNSSSSRNRTACIPAAAPMPAEVITCLK